MARAGRAANAAADGHRAQAKVRQEERARALQRYRSTTLVALGRLTGIGGEVGSEGIRDSRGTGKPGPWNENKPKATPQEPGPSTWDEFTDDVEHERGLFKVLALWVSDQINARKKKSVREYLESKESRKFEAGLDQATQVFDAAIIGPVLALLGLPTLAVGVALVGMQYGYRRLTDPEEDRMGHDEGVSP